MGRQVFVSYKFSDAWRTRDEIRLLLGKEGQYYNGEKGFKPLNQADSTIKEYLKDMIFGTSVTVVVISPQVIFSDWVDWEIRYSLRQPTRYNITSHRNGIVCVVQTQKDILGRENTFWAQNPFDNNYRKDIFPQAIVDNLQRTFPSDENSFLMHFFGLEKVKDYCVVVDEYSFRLNPSKYIEEAHRRAYDDSYEVVVNKTNF